MALTLTLALGTPCQGGNHFTITGTPSPGQARVMLTSRPEILAPLSAEDIETFMRVLVRLYTNQLSGQTPAQMKAAIEAKVLNLTVA